MLLDLDDHQRDRDGEIAKVLTGLQTLGSVQVGIRVVIWVVDLISICMGLLVGGGVRYRGWGMERGVICNLGVVDSVNGGDER